MHDKIGNCQRRKTKSDAYLNHIELEFSSILIKIFFYSANITPTHHETFVSFRQLFHLTVCRISRVCCNSMDTKFIPELCHSFWAKASTRIFYKSNGMLTASVRATKVSVVGLLLKKCALPQPSRKFPRAPPMAYERVA